MRRALYLLGLTVGLFAGCGGDYKSARFDAADGEKAAGGKAAPPGGAPPPANAVERKIIYEGTVALVVPEVDAASEQVRATVKQFDAYISASDVSGYAGSRRTATFTVRVPADKFDAFREAVAKLGEVTRNSSKSEDVTEEFYDLDARIRVLKKEEEALTELLKRDAGKLDELLKVREQLTRNREQIEKAEGRQKYLSAKVTYSTVTVTLSETKDYVPPTSPTFGGRIARSFWQSVDALENAGKGVVYFLAAVAPWSPLILIAVLLFRRPLRAVWSRIREALKRDDATPPPSDPPGSGR